MSSGKVQCTCGWSWNKSDSSKKDMYICHECGRDNSNNMKNGGWLDSYANGGTMQEHQENYNDASVSLPEGFVGMGNNTKGRNYSPAWGGQFQMGGSVYPVNYVPQAAMGGSLPGAGGHFYARYEEGGKVPGDVGFDYPRTINPAPDNGPGAKKTMASAQNGQEMQYYQNGLDWKPKSISKNGSIIKDDDGYWNPDNWGKDVEIDQSNPDSFIDMENVYEPLIGISKETGEKRIMYPGEKHKFGKETKKVIESPLAKNGIRQEQKGLKNLDDLTNFTNYNKPNKNWLNKYN